MRALSLPGCGCRGAFQFAVLARLVAQGERFDLVAGASSGTLAGAAYVAGKSASGPDLYRAMQGTRVLSTRWLRSQRSPFGMSQIVRDALERHLPERDIREGAAELLIATTRLSRFARNLLERPRDVGRGALVVHSTRARADVHDLILASCTFPPFYAKIPRIDGELAIDGGVADNTLIDTLIARGASELTVITPHARGTVYPGLWQAAAVPRVPAHVRLRILHPARPLRLRSFDFDRERLEEALDMPHREAIYQGER